MNSMINGSLQRVDDNWQLPPAFLFYLLRHSIVNTEHNEFHRRVDHVSNVTQSLLGFLQSDVLLFAGLASSHHGSVSSVHGGQDNVTDAWDSDYQGHYYAESTNPFDSRTMNASSSYNGNDYDSAGTTDSNNDVSENYSSPYLMPWPQRTSWIAIFTLMLFVAIVGNTLVAWIVLGQYILYSCLFFIIGVLWVTCKLFIYFLLDSISAHRRMKTVTNYFLVNYLYISEHVKMYFLFTNIVFSILWIVQVNLSLADLTMSLFNCIFNFTFMLNRWITDTN